MVVVFVIVVIYLLTYLQLVSFVIVLLVFRIITHLLIVDIPLTLSVIILCQIYIFYWFYCFNVHVTTTPPLATV